MILPQLEEERGAWERWYLVLRAHLTAYRRPTAAWSRAAAAAASSSTNAPGESTALAASGGEADSSEEEKAAAAAAVAAAVGRVQGRGGGSRSNSRNSAAGGDVGGKFGGGVDAAFLRSRGEEEEAEERVRGLQEVVMKRAGLGGEFDMSKVQQ